MFDQELNSQGVVGGGGVVGCSLPFKDRFNPAAKSLDTEKETFMLVAAQCLCSVVTLIWRQGRFKYVIDS